MTVTSFRTAHIIKQAVKLLIKKYRQWNIEYRTLNVLSLLALICIAAYINMPRDALQNTSTGLPTVARDQEFIIR